MENAPIPSGLRYLEPSPLGALAVARHQVSRPRATLIAIHGGLDRASSFTRLSRRLDDFDVIAYDRRGYQQSRSLGPGTLDQDIDDLRRVIAWATETTGSSAAPVLFGHSFGGLVAMALIAVRPEAAVLTVAYESPLPWVVPRPSPSTAAGESPAREAERFFRRVVSDSSWERLSAVEQESRRLDGPALSADLREMTTARPPFTLDEIRSPVRYLYGDQRDTPYYHELARTLTQANPFFEVRELVATPHGAHLSHPDLLAAEVREAFDNVVRRP